MMKEFDGPFTIEGCVHGVRWIPDFVWPWIPKFIQKRLLAGQPNYIFDDIT